MAGSGILPAAPSPGGGPVALYAAQLGETDPAAKPMRGFGGHSIMEIVAPYDGDTWRTVYTVRFESAIYVLHALIRKRLIAAELDHQRSLD